MEGRDLISRIAWDPEKIAAFCEHWRITELALFGSVLRDDFNEHSDVDVLVRFSPGARRSLVEHVAMEEELSALLGRKAEIVNRAIIEKSENPFRKRAILESAETVYVPG